MQKRKILITGANGLLGKRTVRQLSQHNEIYAVVRNKPEDPISSVHYIEMNLSVVWSIEDLPSDIDIIIHLAQSSKFRDFPDQALDIFNVNIQSTAKLLDYAHKINIQKFIYASSGGVYGTGAKAFDENSPITPSGKLGYYLGSKLCGEVLAQNYANFMNVITLRFFFMYGPEQNKSMLIPRLVEMVRNGQPIGLQGNEGISINPVHVQDATNALEKALDLQESFAFNIAGEQVVSLKMIADTIGNILGKEPVFDISEDEPNNLIADIEEMKRHLITPGVSIEDGLKELS